MIKCQSCPIKIDTIFKWVNSGIGSIQCNQCKRVVANANHVLIIYAIAGIFGAVNINFSTEISELLSSFGFYLTVPFVVIAIIVFSIIFIYCMAVLTVRNNVKES